VENRYRVEQVKGFAKALSKVPDHIALHYRAWVTLVETEGLLEARKVPAYHDEPLRGKWLGYRSVRLSRSYRLFYRLIEGTVTVILVTDVNKHEY